MKKLATLKYIVALFLFGTNGIVASFITLNSYEIVLTRTFIGTLFLTLIFMVTRQPLTFGRVWSDSIYLLLSGISMGASWMFLFEAYRQIGVSVATLAYYCGPVLVMLISPLVFKEKITIVKFFGFWAVLIGIFLVNQTALISGQITWGLGFAMLSAVTYALMVIFNKKARTITGLENPMWQLVASFVTVAVFVVFRQGFSLHIPASNILPVLFLGVVNTGIGCYLYFSSIGELPVQTVAILGYLEPLSALFFSALFLREALRFVQWIGAGLILGGVGISELLGFNRSEWVVKPDS
ncbi:MAG TPA: EamA family transporter [Anaerolineales bacterium]|nr:EamA family transporter [Anaerolineales bacterium]